MEPQKTLNSQSNLENKVKNSRRHGFPDFRELKAKMVLKKRNSCVQQNEMRIVSQLIYTNKLTREINQNLKVVTEAFHCLEIRIWRN